MKQRKNKMTKCIFRKTPLKEFKKLKRKFLIPLKNTLYQYRNKKNKNKKVYIHGNFVNYYYERYKKKNKKNREKGKDLCTDENDIKNQKEERKDFLEDERFIEIEKLIGNIFKDKIILDIGCNCGITSFLLSIQYHCKIVNGIDIDINLINNSIHIVRLFIEFISLYKGQFHMLPFFLNNKKLLQIERNIFEDLFFLYEQQKIHSLEINKTTNIEKESHINSFPFNIYFRCSNILDLSFKKVENAYDVVICFSVIKWIHLNYGDNCVITLFDLVYTILKPSGYFLLEYHNEEKYRIKKSYEQFYNQEITLNYKTFDDILKGLYQNTSRMKLLHTIQRKQQVEPQEEEKQKKKKINMFNRCICIYQKVST